MGATCKMASSNPGCCLGVIPLHYAGWLILLVDFFTASTDLIFELPTSVEGVEDPNQQSLRGFRIGLFAVNFFLVFNFGLGALVCHDVKMMRAYLVWSCLYTGFGLLSFFLDDCSGISKWGLNKIILPESSNDKTVKILQEVFRAVPVIVSIYLLKVKFDLFYH